MNIIITLGVVFQNLCNDSNDVPHTYTAFLRRKTGDDSNDGNHDYTGALFLKMSNTYTWVFWF